MNRSDATPSRAAAMRQIPRGCFVITPLGRRAKVIGHYDDGALELRYTDSDSKHSDNTVRLQARLVRRAD